MKDTNQRGVVYDPFVGGGAVAAELSRHFSEVRMSDTHTDLVMLLDAVVGGWVPPEEISEEEYRELRDESPSPLRGFAGFAGSFGGKWFGGYARGAGRNYAAEPCRNLAKMKAQFDKTTASARCISYKDLTPRDGEVVYCDPPYLGTLGYGGTEAFDHQTFYEVVEGWVRQGVRVYVSEYTAPAHWTQLFEVEHRVSVSLAKDRKGSVEKLFRVESK